MQLHISFLLKLGPVFGVEQNGMLHLPLSWFCYYRKLNVKVADTAVSLGSDTKYNEEVSPAENMVCLQEQLTAGL